MTNTKKMTKKDYFNALLNIPEVGTKPELVAFIDHELELLERKAEKKTENKKPTATQIENEKLKSAILEYMKPGTIYTIKEMLENIEECDGFSTPKMSALLHSLAKEEKVERVEEKRKIYWKLV